LKNSTNVGTSVAAITCRGGFHQELVLSRTVLTLCKKWGSIAGHCVVSRCFVTVLEVLASVAQQ